ncbi:MAG TPA: hypothetical protein PKE63_07915 [Lacibacter sp.]|nr:hypothetical protein [Lacibacter sp.]HMO89364.1 hypothetical protein [Lacibacter sp.]HMP87191.1 hypothetical protein [Lacibacter sp.]
MNDSLLQERLLRSAEPPPPRAWEEVSRALETIPGDTAWAAGLESLTTPPPPSAWEAVVSELDERDFLSPAALQLQQLEQVPPPQAWNAIEQQLDEATLAHTLRQLEIAPPASVWEGTEEQLNGNSSSPVVDLRPRFPLLRVAAAVAAFALLTWGLYQLLLPAQETLQETVAVQAPAQREPMQTLPRVPDPADMKTVTAEQQAAPASFTRNKITIPMAAAAAVGTPPTPTQLLHRKPAGTRPAGGFVETDYLMVLNDKGELIRVSPKLSRMKCVTNDTELPVDAVAALRSRNCDDVIRQWQERMALSTAASALGGTFDLEEIIRTTER